VPLYRLKANNIDAINPAATAGDTEFGGGMGMFVFRVRTPCKVWEPVVASGELDSFECKERWELNVDDTDDTIINWEISGYDGHKNIVTFYSQNIRDNQDPPQRMVKKNSEIYEQKVNMVKSDSVLITLPDSTAQYLEKYTVLKDKNNTNCSSVKIETRTQRNRDTSKCSGKDVNDYVGSIFEFLKSDSFQQVPFRLATDLPTDKDWKRSVDKPYLKFTTIYPFEDKDQKIKIPYLEYQIITDKPIAGNLQIIDVNATVGGFRQSLQVKKPVQSSVLEFAVHN